MKTSVTTAPDRMIRGFLLARPWLPSLARVTVALALAAAAPSVALAAALALRRALRMLHDDASRLLVGLRTDTLWPLLLVAGTALGCLIAFRPFPPDDLARDLVAWAAGFDYRQAFWGSPLVPGYDQYWGFDRLAAWAWHFLPAGWRALPFQLVPLAGLLAVLVLDLKKVLHGTSAPRLAVAVFLLLALLMPGTVGRLVQGRPEAWLAIWTLSALVLPGWIWFVIGLLLAPLYWLAPVYAAGCLLLRSPLRRRLLQGSCYLAASSLLWIWLSHGEWLHGLAMLHAEVANRLAPVQETETIWMLAAGTGAALYAAAAWYFRRGFSRVDWPLWLVLAVFLLPDMARYALPVTPLLVLLLARAAARQPERWTPSLHRPLRVAVVWCCLFMLPLAFKGAAAPAPGFLARVQPGERILAPFSPLMYRALYAAAPRGGRLAPAMELGMTDQDIQRLAIALGEGRIDCAGLRSHRIDWIVEDRLAGTLPACLHLDSTDRGLRAWRVLSAGVVRRTQMQK